MIKINTQIEKIDENTWEKQIYDVEFNSLDEYNKFINELKNDNYNIYDVKEKKDKEQNVINSVIKMVKKFIGIIEYNDKVNSLIDLANSKWYNIEECKKSNFIIFKKENEHSDFKPNNEKDVRWKYTYEIAIISIEKEEVNFYTYVIRDYIKCIDCPPSEVTTDIKQIDTDEIDFVEFSTLEIWNYPEQKNKNICKYINHFHIY